MIGTVIRLRVPQTMLQRIKVQGERLAFEGNLAGCMMHLLRMGLLQAESQSGQVRQASASEDMARALIGLLRASGPDVDPAASTNLDTMAVSPDQLGQEIGEEEHAGEGEESD